MNQKYVTSLELSKKLKEAGIPQESEWYWVLDAKNVDINGNAKYEWMLESGGHLSLCREYCSAFHVGELGEMLPRYYKTVNGNDEKWYVRNQEDDEDIVFCENTEAEARGNMLLYLKENNLI